MIANEFNALVISLHRILLSGPMRPPHIGNKGRAHGRGERGTRAPSPNGEWRFSASAPDAENHS